MADIDFITPRRIACGFMHTAMLSTTAKSEDDAESSHDSTSLFMWGCNRYNMIGANCGHKDDDEMETMLKLPQNITSRISKEKGLEDFSRKYIYEVACGGFHTVLLDKRPDADGGLIWVMGLANNGRLGVGMENPAEVEAQWYAVPRQVGFPDGARVARIACGADHTLAIGENGAVFAWGLGNYGNLGTGSTEDCWTPAPVAVLDGTSQPVVGIAAGAKHSLAVTQYFPDLMSGGNLFAWGFGGSGRLGLGNTRASLKPSMIEHPGTFVDLCCGEASSGAIDLHGAVYTWGCGSFGRLGHGEETDTPLPREVESLGGTPCMQLAMGMTHAVVVTRKGRLFAWGQGAGLGLLDENDHSVVPTPREVLQPDLDKTLVTQVACGTYHSLVVTKDGELFSWGTGTEGRLGISGSAFKTEAFPKPLAITGGAKGWVGDPAEDNANHKKKRERGGGKEDDTNTVIAVSAGGSHTALLFGTAATTAAGGCDMWMWGGGDHGQTGLGKLVDELEPKCAIPSASMSSVKVTMVACGVYHTLIVSSTSSLYSFGSGEFGQLGNGNTGSITIPELVNLRGVVSIAAGEDHSAAVLQSGELFTWGSADSGKLGVGAAMTSGIIGLPRQVPKLTEQIKDVDCGQSHTAAVASDGSLYTFGAGWFGRLGHNSTANKYSAAKVLPFGEDEPFPVTIVACGSYHTCAVHEGYLYICGRDRSVCQPDHLKAFTKMAFDRDPKEPAPIITAIACGDQHSMVIAQDLFNKEDPKAISYSLWCWGDNKKGQIAGKTQRVEFPEKIRGIPHGFVPRLLSTGTAHSILAGELRNGKTKVYVWGHGGCGRLGVELSMEDDKPVRLQYNQPTELVCPWEEEEKKTSAQPEEPAIETAVAEEDAPAEETSVKEGGAKERMSLFARIVQHLVEEEEETPQCMEENLQKEHLKLSQEFEEVMRKIRAIWKLEEEQNRQEDLLEGSIVQNMKLMHPKNDLDLSKSKILPEVSSVLHLVEKLFFYLQQQPIYLTSLCVPDAKKVEGLGDGGLGVRDELTAEECELVVRVVTAIFADMHFPRVKHLYQSLLKEIGQAEFEKAKRIEEILERVQLDKPKSPLVPLLQYMSKANEYKIGDTSTGGKGERGMGQAMLDLSSKDQPSILASLLAEKVGEGKNESDLVIYLDETEHKDFSTGDVTAIRIEVQRHTDRLSHWVEKHFLPMVVALPFHEDFKSYFVQIKEKLEDKFRNDPAGDRIFDIMTSIFIVGILEPIFADALTYAPRKWGLHKMNPDQYEMLGKFGTFIGLVGRVNLLSTFAPNLTNVGRGLRQKLQYAIFNDPSRNLDGIMFKNAMDKAEVNVTIDLYTSHLQRRLLTISIPTGPMMRFVNLMYRYRNVMRIKEQSEYAEKGTLDPDVLNRTLKKIHYIVEEDLIAQKAIESTEEKEGRKIEVWPEDKVLMSEINELVHNFTINPRWLLEYPTPTFCPDSLVPIPWALSREEDDGGDIVYLREYEPVLCASELNLGGGRPLLSTVPDRDPRRYPREETPFRRLEALFGTKDQRSGQPLLKNISKDNFMAVKYEFDDMQKQFMQAQVPDFVATKILEKGKKDLDILRQGGYEPADLEVFVTEAKQARETYQGYLQAVRDNIENLITKQLDKTEKDLVKSKTTMEAALRASKTASIPNRFEQEAQKHNLKLKFPSMLAKKKKKMGDLEEGDSEFEGFPEATFPLSFLRARRVVCRVNSGVNPDEEVNLFRNLYFTFRATASGDWEVEITKTERTSKHSILEFVITKQDITQMRGAGKTARLPFGTNDFVILQAFNVLQLLARIRCGVS